MTDNILDYIDNSNVDYQEPKDLTFNEDIEDDLIVDFELKTGGIFAQNEDDMIDTFIGAAENPDAKTQKNKQYTVEYDREKPHPIDNNLHVNDLNTLVLAEINRKGIAGDHIRSMNTFYKEGLKQIITKIFHIDMPRLKNKRDKQEEDKEIDYISFSVDVTNINIVKPQTNMYKTHIPQMLTPNNARINNLTYQANLFISMEVKTTAYLKNGKVKDRAEHINDFKVASIPVMVGSDLCNLHNLTREAVKQLNEDPNDPRGYFIIKGKEWSVDKSENLVLNMLHGYKNMYGREIVRGTFQSKPGDAYENSYYMIIRYLNDAQITISIVTNKFEALEIPYYLLFRAFGMTRDRDVVNNIVYGVDNKDPVTTHMVDVLEKAFNAPNKEFAPVLKSIDSNEILGFISSKMNELAQNASYKRDDNAVKYINTSTFNLLDKYILPHIGSAPESRTRKLRFLGHMIHKLLRIEMGLLDSTDRDSYRNKRVHAAGIQLGKTTKTQWNFTVAQPIKKELIKAFQNNPWSQVKLDEVVRGAVNAEDLCRALVKSITTGEKTVSVGNNEIINRVSSQQINRKNDLNVVAILNNITTHGQSAAKATDRAQDMRMPHNTYFGYIGLNHSPDTGEKVGMNKQMACMVSVTEASSSQFLKYHLLQDKDVIPLDLVLPEEITVRNLTKIFVNGDWIGFCERGHELVEKYRTARRYGNINPYTSIVWEVRVSEVYFWTDVGRLIRPFVIVYNNEKEYLAYLKTAKRGGLDKSEDKPDEKSVVEKSDEKSVVEKSEDKSQKLKFQQWIKLTKKHIMDLQAGIITMEDLRKERVIEYITPEEQENILLARNLEVLRENKDNILMPFTHCDVEISLFGLIELSAPNTNHTASSRITMFTNQKKQTCGWFAHNWPHRIDKNTILQWYCQMPIVRAFTNSITTPNAQNVILAYQALDGFGQEDSLILNRSSVDRGLFQGSHFYYEAAQLEKGEMFGNPDFSRTLDIKKDAVYSHVEKGVIREGTIVRKGYVLIVKTVKLLKPMGDKEQYLFADRSIIYRAEEEAIVERVIPAVTEDDAPMIKVKLRSCRPITIGDKLSSFAGCKGICAIKLDQADMPYTEEGLKPDIIINPHSIPTRMVISQVIETMMAELAVKQGCLLDGTPFKTLDIDGMQEELEKTYGVKYGGQRRMFNGRSGCWFDALIFIGPTSYQRLQKFVIDESYAMSSGPICALTRQPLDGKAYQGGLRLGEMEKDVLVCQSTIRLLYEKFNRDSDGIELFVCRICGNRCIINEKAGIYKCAYCGDNADIARVPSSWVANLFFNTISSMGVKTRFELEPFAYPEYQ